MFYVKSMHAVKRQMKKYLAAIMIAFLFIPSEAICQTLEQNLQKYWYYRDRLKTQFMVVDNNNAQGTNIPATRRFEQNGQTILRWGDAEGHLGMYIAVLATEYKLLKDNHQKYDETLQELNNAMQAFERLDEFAEYWWRDPHVQILPYDINGFFIRDDVGSNPSHDNFLLNHPKSKLAQNGITKIESDFISGDDGGRPCEMSQDQVWLILPGLALVETLVDEPSLILFDALGDSVTFREWTRKITHRMISYIQGTQCQAIWQIINPTTLNPVRRGDMLDESFLMYNTRHSYGFASAGDQITRLLGYESLHYDGSEHPDRRSQYFTLASATGCEIPFWLGYLGVPDPRHASYSFRTLMTIEGSEAPVTEPIPCWTDDRYDYFTWLQTMYALTEYHEHLALIYGMLHKFPVDPVSEKPVINHQDKKWYNIYKNLLDSAPECGPYNFDAIASNNWPHFEWSSYNRLIWPQRIGDSSGKIGFYNGLDYMLLHNLFCLAYENFHKEVRLEENSPVIRSTDITSVNEIEPGHSVSFIADRRVSLKPGFHASRGAEFKASIDSQRNFSYRKLEYRPMCNFDQPQPAKMQSQNATEFHLKKAIHNQTRIDWHESVKSDLHVFPNPSTGQFNIYCANPEGWISEIKIRNSIGQTIFTKSGIVQNPMTINLDGHSAGIYLIELSFSDFSVYKKVVVR